MIIKDLPASEYHARPEISLHQLLEYSKSPAHGEYKRKNPVTPTPAMEFGSAFHSYVLDSTTEFYRQYAIKPEGDGRSKEIRAWCSKNIGKAHIKEREFSTIKGMTRSLEAFAEDRFNNYLDHNEISIFVENEGVQVRSRLDHIDSPAISDLKTTDSAHPDDFLKSVINFRYYIQAAFYLDNANLAGLNVNEFYFWAIEKTPPYGVSKLRLSEEFIHVGRLAYRELLANYRECRDNNYFPSYPTSTITLYPPQYLTKAA